VYENTKRHSRCVVHKHHVIVKWRACTAHTKRQAMQQSTRQCNRSTDSFGQCANSNRNNMYAVLGVDRWCFIVGRHRSCLDSSFHAAALIGAGTRHLSCKRLADARLCSSCGAAIRFCQLQPFSCVCRQRNHLKPLRLGMTSRRVYAAHTAGNYHENTMKTRCHCYCCSSHVQR
jgi:hypothetical protein